MPEPRERAWQGQGATMPRRALIGALRVASLVVVTLAAPAAACVPGGAVRCVPQGTLDPGARPGGLTRADIDALVNLPGPAVTEAVRRDTARTFETVRRQSLPPAIAYPADPVDRRRKGDDTP